MAEKAIDEAGFFMLFSSTSNCAVRSDIEGLVYRGSGNSDFTRITFKSDKARIVRSLTRSKGVADPFAHETFPMERAAQL